MASFPTSVKSFTNRSAGQTIGSAHVNDLQDEVNAIEAGYLQGSAPLNSSNSTLASLSVAGGSTIAGSLSVGAAFRCGNSTTLTLSTGDTHNYALPSTVFIVSLTGNSSGSTLTGMSTATEGRVIILSNIGSANSVVLANEAGSSATCRFTPGSTVAGGDSILAIYVSNRWRLLKGGV